jgi:hypothetical protein
MKYLWNSDKVYYLYYTYVKIFRIKKVATKWIKLIVRQRIAKAAQILQYLLIITWIENQI